MKTESLYPIVMRLKAENLAFKKEIQDLKRDKGRAERDLTLFKEQMKRIGYVVCGDCDGAGGHEWGDEFNYDCEMCPNCAGKGVVSLTKNTTEND